ncbi:general substrate transporter [Mollisia scopiformis]|uniref:General substrate transporter n=1 Tax=Mollisia scopiformis TaxID=149040 RepID=A0A194XGY4_MOLSC|nr:general substrate transporter [Mollisia scopiformis]KUJ19032.1 general substrate transporter [Mollisia scopiformis]
MLALLRLLSKHKAALFVAAVASTASLLFGYDTGVAGSVVALKSFSSEFKFSTDAAKAADISSNIVALLNAGAFFGALAPAISSRYFGRKIVISVAACFLLLGGILQTAAQPLRLSMIYGGRVISGFGVGMVSNLVPLYVAETSPKELRGLLMSLFEMFLVSGGLLAYWTTYGCSVHLEPTSKQWRIPLSIQITLAEIVLGGSFAIVESPRWLAKQGRWDEAGATLAYLRGISSDESELKCELAEMYAQLDEELRTTAGRSVKEMLQRANFFRILWGCGIAFFNIWCGQNAILYYAPTIFKRIGFRGQNPALFASGIFTVIKVVVTIAFLVLGVQNFGRRSILSVGSFCMMAMLFSLGAVLKTHPPITGQSINNSPSGRAKMATVYLYIIAYSMSWGPLIWVYMGEIFPTRIRDYSMAVATMVVWFFNFVVSKWTPAMILHIGWKTWIVFGTMNAVGFLFTLFLPETKSLSLEEMDVLFHVVDQSTRLHDIEDYIATPQPEATNKSEL